MQRVILARIHLSVGVYQGREAAPQTRRTLWHCSPMCGIPGLGLAPLTVGPPERTLNGSFLHELCLLDNRNEPG